MTTPSREDILAWHDTLSNGGHVGTNGRASHVTAIVRWMNGLDFDDTDPRGPEAMADVRAVLEPGGETPAPLEFGDDDVWEVDPVYAERDRLVAEVERLRNIIGELYMQRGKDRMTLYSAIRRAFGASQPAVAEMHWQQKRDDATNESSDREGENNDA